MLFPIKCIFPFLSSRFQNFLAFQLSFDKRLSFFVHRSFFLCFLIRRFDLRLRIAFVWLSCSLGMRSCFLFRLSRQLFHTRFSSCFLSFISFYHIFFLQVRASWTISLANLAQASSRPFYWDYRYADHQAPRWYHVFPQTQTAYPYSASWYVHSSQRAHRHWPARAHTYWFSNQTSTDHWTSCPNSCHQKHIYSSHQSYRLFHSVAAWILNISTNNQLL